MRFAYILTVYEPASDVSVVHELWLIVESEVANILVLNGGAYPAVHPETHKIA